MNYLAHLYLAGDSQESILGNFLGDFVKGSAIHCYSQGIQQGIKQHRKIDAFTDSHPVFIDSKRLISQSNRRYAGILVDIFYDHFLATQWETYSAIPLNKFTIEFYKLLEDSENILPESLKRVLPRLKHENWLMSYGDVQGINQTFHRLALRIKRENNVKDAVKDLTYNYQYFKSNFKEFFFDLMAYNQTLK